MLEIAKHPARIQQMQNLAVQSPLALMYQMMNREAGNHCIKLPEHRQRRIQVVVHDAHARVRVESFPDRGQHGRRKINRHRRRVRMVPSNDRQQAPVAGAQIKNPLGVWRNEFQQRSLSLGPVRNLIRALQVITNVLARSPQVDGASSAHAKSIGKRLHSISMNRTEVARLGIRWSLFLVVLAALACPLTVVAQNNLSSDQASQSPPAQQPAKPADPPDERKGDVKITPRQAEELFHSVDEILAFDSRETGLPVKHEVKRKLTGRDEVVSFLTKHLNDEDTQRLRRSELVLKKFGLLPRDFNLETFLVALLREEVAGYYDPKTKTVNLLDWVPIEEQEPVMALELTHALQDQDVYLQKWMKRGEKDLAEIKKDPTPADIENDEMDNAREAVLEGQAQAMMFQYAIAPAGHSITTSPELVGAMEEESLTGTPNTKVFNDAPIFLRESLTFPYSYGMDFVIKLLQKGGKSKAFAGILANPPHTTRQIMQPETYLSGEKIEPMSVPDFKHDFKDYQKFDIGAMGEFDVAVLVEQYADKRISKQMYPEWRGGYYYAAKSRTNPSGPLALLYVSRWSNPVTAAQFAGIYAHSLRLRYKKVAVIGDPADAEQKPPDKDASPPPLQGRHSWSTEEGTVVIEEKGETVFITESLDDTTIATLEKEVLGTLTGGK